MEDSVQLYRKVRSFAFYSIFIFFLSLSLSNKVRAQKSESLPAQMAGKTVEGVLTKTGSEGRRCARARRNICTTRFLKLLLKAKSHRTFICSGCRTQKLTWPRLLCWKNWTPDTRKTVSPSLWAHAFTSYQRPGLKNGRVILSC